MRGTRTTARARTLLAAPLISLALLTLMACGSSDGSGSDKGEAAAPSSKQPAGQQQPESQPDSDGKAPAEDPAKTADPGNEADSDPSSASPNASVRTADSDLGTILVDGKGRTLYGFTKDKPGQANCDANCIAVWPALTSAKDIEAGPGTQASLLTESKLSEGTEQAVYGDWPLYYYVGDTVPGDVNGQGLDGEWFVVAADGKLIRTESESVV